MRAVILYGGFLLLSGGCALLPGPAESAAKTGSVEVIGAAAERVWPLLPEVYASLDLAVTTIDPKAQVVASTRAYNIWGFRVGPREAPYGRCTVPRLIRSIAARVDGPVPVSIPPGRLMVSVESTLMPAGTATQVQTRLILSPVSLSSAARSEEPYCVSTGRLEAQIAEALRERISAEST